MSGRGKNSESGEYDVKTAPEGYEYLTGIVKDVISDPDITTLSNTLPLAGGEKSIFTLLSENTSNPALLSIMPRNSAIVYIIDESQSKKGTKQPE